MITFIRSAPLDVTPAVQRYVSFLRKHGFSDQISAIEISFLPRKTPLKFIDKIVSFSRPFGTTKERITTILTWQLFQLKVLLRLKPCVIQFSDIFSAIPAILIKPILRCKLVFDIRDNAKLVVSHRSKFMGACLGLLENIAVRASDAVISVNEPLLDFLPQSCLNKSVVIPNIPSEDIYTGYEYSDKGNLVVNLSGFVSHRRNIAAWGEVSTQVPSLRLDIYGTTADDETAELLKSIKIYPIPTYTNSQSLDRMTNCHVVSLMYDPAIAINQYASPNKYYEALMLGKPIICAHGMKMGNEIKHHACGVVVDYGDPISLHEAVKTLQNTEYRKQMGINARNLFTTNYKNMSKRNMRHLYNNLGMLTSVAG